MDLFEETSSVCGGQGGALTVDCTAVHRTLQATDISVDDLGSSGSLSHNYRWGQGKVFSPHTTPHTTLRVHGSAKIARPARSGVGVFHVVCSEFRA